MDTPTLTLESTETAPGVFHAAHGSETPLKLERRVVTGKSSGLVGVGGVLPPMLDACCGSRMFWFDRSNPLALYMDKREEQHVLCDGRELKIAPDVVADFTDMPFPDESFWLVVFDPPHMNSLGANSWLAKKYGRLIGDWRDDLREGFSECFRVLKNGGVLIFKWNECDVPLAEILKLTPHKPLFGHPSGKAQKTHWCCFWKSNEKAEP